MELQSFLGIFLLLLATPEPSWGISRSEVISNAETWLRPKVPYSQSKYKDGYRTDCSGYVSMAWATGTNYYTGSLGGISTSISKEDLKAGDILLKTGRGAHVVIFDQWEDESTKNKYWIYEQAGGRINGTIYRKVTYPYSSNPQGYYPRRYNNITD